MDFNAEEILLKNRKFIVEKQKSSGLKVVSEIEMIKIFESGRIVWFTER